MTKQDKGELVPVPEFNDPPPRRGHKGRPQNMTGSGWNEHVPNDATREMVKLGTVLGYSQERSAELLGITIPVLHKHYRYELDCGMEGIHLGMLKRAHQLAMQDKHLPTALQASLAILSKAPGWKSGGVVAVANAEVQDGSTDGKVVKVSLKIGVLPQADA